MYNNRTVSLNEEIEKMLKDNEGIKRFYQFIYHNPHLSLHNACQIVIRRPNASICYSFDEWNQMNRRIRFGSKGILYYDENSNRRFVFDINDTYGFDVHKEKEIPMEAILKGFGKINQTNLFKEPNMNDFDKIRLGVETYFQENGYYSEGVAYLLYLSTDKARKLEVNINGLPYSLDISSEIITENVTQYKNLKETILMAYEQVKIDEEKKIKESKEKPKSKPKSKAKEKEEIKVPTLFDFLDENPFEEEKMEDPKEELIKNQLKRGSGFENGKFRIYENYQADLTKKDFASFLKDEYGIGGSYFDVELTYNSKGFKIKNEDYDIFLKWNEVAEYISNLIDKEEYFTEAEKKEYEQYILGKNNEKSNLTIQQKITSIVDFIINEGTENTNEGNWNIYFDEFGKDEEFVKEHKDEILSYLEEREEVADVVLENDRFEVNYYLDCCANFERNEEQELETLEPQEEQEEDLGGLKTRYRGNIEAIKLTNRLYEENRNPALEEREILSKYVGWGGIPQAFDEANPSWQKEYLELKELLSLEDYERARGSVLNAHYTSKDVIDGIYNALVQFGVGENNKILEPAIGTGNFFKFMPNVIRQGSKLYGVELDNLTGRIVSKLNPEANIQIKGFEQTTFPNNHFDLVVTNVPFGGYGVYDKEYTSHNFLIHDYFIAKSIDKVKPNGIVAVITSKGTMDKQSSKARKYMADRAELIGAIRLPNNAFKSTAKTEVVADILFFQKREEKIDATLEDCSWLGISKTEDGFEMNNYFIENPQMILGNIVLEVGLYGAEDITVKSRDKPLAEELNQALFSLPKDIYQNPISPIEEQVEQKIEVDYDVKPMCYKAQDNHLYMRIGDEMVEQQIPSHPKDAYERIVHLIDLRKRIRHILDLQIEACSDRVLSFEQEKLNKDYDSFVKKYGFLNSQTNRRLFKEDADSALVFASETLSEDKKTATKTDIFFKRTIRPYTSVTKTDDTFEALQISKNERGKVDLEYIEELTGKDLNAIIKELDTAIFRNPLKMDIDDDYSGYETSEEYLSGNVKEKLEQAKIFAKQYPLEFDKNIKALEEVQPEPLTASEISVRIGTSWIDKEYYRQFLCELLNIPYWYQDGLDLYYNPHDSSWRVEKTTSYMRNYRSMQITDVYGTRRANAFALFEDALNLRTTTIYDTIEEGDKTRRVLNQAETITAREKQNKIKEAFRDWIFQDPERRDDLEKTYNSLFNQIRLPNYDGSYLKFPQMNPLIELKPHQKDAVHRIITSGNTLLHHVVGAGKTYTICAAAMKLRQYGLAKKPMIVVPNHLVGQWANEFRTLYPNANLLIASKEDLEKENRKRFVSRVAMGDWDAVIIAQSSFAKIPISQERQLNKIREEIHNIVYSIKQQQEEGTRGSVKNLERIKKSKEVQLQKLLDDDKKDTVLIFENLGVDYLFIDEAHYYKNLFLYTKMHNVAGISNTASQRASDLELKCEYINELHNKDMGVVFATGTPISNSMTEMYTMQNYLQKRTLKRIGLNFFDNWAADFGETITSLEMAPSGQGYKAKTRFAKFTNLPELLTLYRSFADVKTSDMVKLNVPKVDKKVITLKPTDMILALAEEIAERAELISDGNVDPREDNMLKITSDGKKLALDPRCYDSSLLAEASSKLNECSQNIYDIWLETKEILGTQLVFCDLSTPKKDFKDYVYCKDFDVYNELKYLLTRKGIPAEEIAYIHEANTDLQKQTLFGNVNEGKIRVLIGSTEKCGAGTNVQKRLIALHHLDTPYRPSDLQQREGRIVRQGNTNKEVKIFTYVTERTFDSYSYQILENKQRFISQIDRGDLTVREADDIDEATLSYAEIKAITAANPKIKRKMELDTEIARLRVLEGQYKKNLYYLQDKIRRTYPEQIQQQNLYLERVKKDIEVIQEKYKKDTFSIEVLGTLYTDKKQGAEALMTALNTKPCGVDVAEYGGFKIALQPQSVFESLDRTICLTCNGTYDVYIGTSAIGNIQRLDNFIADFPKKEELATTKLNQLTEDLEVAKKEVLKPFEHKIKLDVLSSELAEINTELNLTKKEEVIIDDESDHQRTINETLYIPDDFYVVQKPKRKTLTNKIKTQYIEEVEKDPKAFIFISNHGYYECLGEQALEIAGVYEFDIDYTDDLATLSLEQQEFDTLLNKINSTGRKIKIIEEKEDNTYTQIDYSEVGENGVVPDFSLTEEKMKSYGYEWEGMFPISKQVAKTLYKDIAVFRLYQDNSESMTDSLEEINNHNGLFGIEKLEWEDFINKEGLDYIYARCLMADSASKVIKELNFVDERFILKFSDENTIEREILNKYLSTKHDLSVKAFTRYGEALLEEFTSRIGVGGDEGYLFHYGWDMASVKNALIENLANDEMKAYLKAKPSKKDFYRKSLSQRIGLEYDEYMNELKKKSTKEVIDETYKINFYKEINDYFANFEVTDIDEEIAKALGQEQTSVLSLMYDYFLKNEYASVNSYEEIDNFIKSYIEYYNLNQEENGLEQTKQESKNSNWIKVSISQNALIKQYEKHSMLRMPTNSEYKDYAYTMFNNRIMTGTQLVDLASDGRERCYQLLLKDDETITLFFKEEKKEISALEFKELVDGSSNKNYERKKFDSDRIGFTLPAISKLMNYEKSTLFKMPKGEYQGYSFYLPNSFIGEGEELIHITLPSNYEVRLIDKKEDKTIDLTASLFIPLVVGKEDSDFTYYKKPSEAYGNQFQENEERLDLNVPEEMKKRPNWVVLRRRKNEETGKIEKYLIDPKTNKFAKSDDPSTWTSYEEAKEFAKAKGGETLVYCLDGQDNICCIDLDHCIDEDGKYSELAQEVIRKAGGTYCEKSVSGKGLHLFGKTEGMDLRAFSQDGDLEFYQKTHFIAMTGNVLGETALLNFDTSPVKEVLERKCNKRNEISGFGLGIEGLSNMSDIEVVERACNSKHGEIFKALYEGEDLQNNHSNSDMALMNRLAFWCNGDKEQMLRIFATSGLYRENKSINYYESTVIKAIKGTKDRYSPMQSNPKVSSNQEDKDGK